MNLNGTKFSFLDLAVLPEVGRALLDPRPAFVFQSDGSRVLWANAAGVAWFNADSAAELAARVFSPRNPAVRDITRLAASLPVGASQLALLRFPRGVGLAPLAGTCMRLALPDGSSALLVRAADDDSERAGLESSAREILQTLEGEGELVAVFDAEGGILVYSAGFDGLDPVADQIEALVAAFASGSARIVSDAVTFADAPLPVRLARVAAAVGDLLILVVGGAKSTSATVETMAGLETLIAPSPLPRAAVPPAPPPRPVLHAEMEPIGVAALAPEPVPEPVAERAEPEPVLSADAPAPEPVDAPVDEPSSTWSGQLLHPAVPTGTPAPTVPAAPVEPLEPVSVAPSPAPPLMPPLTALVRFVWQMDETTRFTLVSEEFIAAVGPRAADIVGKSWADVAAERAVDPDGKVARALDRHDTWSGITVEWPVDGRGDRVAVDLAALPAFSRERQFVGYRGFGVVRPIEHAAREASASEPVAEVTTPPAKDVTARPSNVEALPLPPADRTSNIVRLRGRTDQLVRSEVLTGHERDAFRRIAEELGVPMAGDAATEVPKASPASETPTPGAGDGSEASTLRPGLDLRLLDRLPIGVVIFREQVTLFVNRAALDLLGYSSQDEFVSAGGVESVFPGTENDWSNDGGDQLLARRSDRSEVAVEARLNTTPWGEGLALLLSLYRPSPARPVAPPVPVVAEAPPPRPIPVNEARVAELEAILDTATDGVILLDSLGLILSLNRSAEALFGINADDAVGRPFTNLMAEESRKSALDYLDGLARNGVASLLNDGREVIGRVPRGGLIPLFMTIGRLDEGGKFCVVLRDITQWKNAEEELVAARRQAEVANNQKSDFLAKISHEIRTPLNAVIGFSEVMMEERFGPIGSDRYREYLRDIHLSGMHLMSLINDLLDISKIEAGKLELKFESVAANAIIQECVALMQPEANRERIIIRTSLSAGLPDIVVDRRSLRQIVLNLLSNAIKFTEPGGQVIVSTTLEESGEVTIRIRDTGIGMSEKEIETALMPFRQVTTPGRTTAPGTGLGLPLTKALVEANRATFSIDSAVDQGTLVRITFPGTRVLAS